MLLLHNVTPQMWLTILQLLWLAKNAEILQCTVMVLKKIQICSLRWVVTWREWYYMHGGVPQQKDKGHCLEKGFRHRAEKGLFVWKSAACLSPALAKPASTGCQRVQSGIQVKMYGLQLEELEKWELWKQGGARKGGWEARQAVEQMWAELRMSFTQRHSPIDASATAWSREGEGDRNNIKLWTILTHSPAGPHCSQATFRRAEHMAHNLAPIPKPFI